MLTWGANAKYTEKQTLASPSCQTPTCLGHDDYTELDGVLTGRSSLPSQTGLDWKFGAFHVYESLAGVRGSRERRNLQEAFKRHGVQLKLGLSP